MARISKASIKYLESRGFDTDPRDGLPRNVTRDEAFENIRDELQNQYDNLVAYDPELAYRGRSSDLPRIFDQQANQLADAGVVTITSLRNVNDKLVDIYQTNGKTGGKGNKVIATTNLKGQITTDRDTGAVKWGDIFSGVKGGANYGISFDPSGSPIFYPVYEKSKSPIAQIGLGGLESVIAPILTIAGAAAGIPGLGTIGGAAAGAAVGNTTGQLLASGKVDWEKVALSAAGAAAGKAIFGGAGDVGGTGDVGAQPTAVGGTPGVSEVFPVTPPAPINVAPLPPQAAGAGLGASANAPGSGMAVQVGPNSTPVPGSVSLKDTLGITSKYGEGATLVPGSEAEALALKTGATLAPVAIPGGSAAPIVDKSFRAPDVPEPFTPTPISETVVEALKSIPATLGTAGTLLAGSAVLGALTPQPEVQEEPPGEAPKVYEPRGFDVRLSDVAPIDVAGTPIPTINFSGATPVETGGLAAPRGLGSLIGLPAYAPTLVYAPTTEGQAMESVYLLPPELAAEDASVAPVTPMREGGLAAVAQELASKGRGGDTMLAHITPEEAGLLKALGGAGTINPETGLPEFLRLFPKGGIKLNLGPLGNVKIGKKSSDLLTAAAVGYGAPYLGMTAGQAAIAYGGLRAAATGNLMEGIQAGLSAYGMGSGMQSAGVGGYGQAAPATVAPIETRTVGEGFGRVSSANVPLTSDVAVQGLESGLEAIPSTVQTAPGAGFELPAGGNTFSFDASGDLITASQAGADAYVAGIPESQTLAQQRYLSQNPYAMVPKSQNPVFLAEQAAAQKAAADAAASEGYLRSVTSPATQKYIPDFLLDASGTTLAGGAFLGSGLISGQQERAAFARQQEEAERKRLEKLGIYKNLAQRTMGGIRMARAGGLMSLAGGGMTYMEAGGTTGPTGSPRDVTGTGDGMSDSVPATIEDIQEARLADGEFVIPADVVADIGNGSSDAGSKKLYDMMDRIRKARHGTTKQPPEIKAERLMPA